MFSILDPRVWLLCAALAAGGFAAGYAKRWAGESERWEARVRDAERAAANKLIRTYEQQQEGANRARQETESAVAAAAAADSASQRLRQRLAEATLRAAASGSIQATAAAIDLSADVQRRIDEAAGQLARIADERRIAGLSCERDYASIGH